MTFWQHFLRLLVRRPRPALAALYWHITRRRVRARNRLRVASADLGFAYALWIDSTERNEQLADAFKAAMEKWSFRPSFTVLPYAQGPFSEQELARSLKSLERQLYSSWGVCGEAAEPLAERIERVEGDFLIPLRVGDALSDTALFRFAEALQSNRTAAILYGDHDEIGRRGRRDRPWFKPRWNEEMFLAQDYLSGALAIETGLGRCAAASASDDFDSFLLSAMSIAGNAIIHVPHILAHVSEEPDVKSPGRIAAVAKHLRHTGAECTVGPFETVKVEWPLPKKLPLVTIIVPTKDKIELLRPCVEGVLERTDYSNLELLIVDNGSVEPRTAAYLDEVVKDPKVRLLTYPGPYNFSAINNFAVKHARGQYLCLLNNDTEVVTQAWLSEMMRYALRPHVAAVGAKLLYEDGSIQHAGVVIGIGEAAGHAHRFLRRGEPGYFRQPHVAQFISAVTAACLVVKKEKFVAVGGLDEVHLPVAFNDVDLCLKLEAAGWRNVYVPHAVLLHHESKSRGNDIAPQNIERYRRELRILQERWGTKTYDDPLHNPNLDRYSETFVIAF